MKSIKRRSLEFVNSLRITRVIYVKIYQYRDSGIFQIFKTLLQTFPEICIDDKVV